MATDLPPGRFVTGSPPDATYVLDAAAGYFQMSGQPLTLRLNPELRFVEGSELFRLVTAFLGALAGQVAVFDSATYPDFPRDRLGHVSGVARGRTPIELAQVVQRIRAQQIGQAEVEALLCGMLAVAVWEQLRLKDRSHFKQNDPHFLVLYHLRNAAAHGNNWTFKNDQPKVAVTWRHITISKPSPPKGKCFGNDVGPGDLLLLLAAIDERLHPGAPKIVIEDWPQARAEQGHMTPATAVAIQSRKL